MIYVLATKRQRASRPLENDEDRNISEGEEPFSRSAHHMQPSRREEAVRGSQMVVCSEPRLYLENRQDHSNRLFAMRESLASLRLRYSATRASHACDETTSSHVCVRVARLTLSHRRVDEERAIRDDMPLSLSLSLLRNDETAASLEGLATSRSATERVWRWRALAT